jgi:hypothetical protein
MNVPDLFVRRTTDQRDCVCGCLVFVRGALVALAFCFWAGDAWLFRAFLNLMSRSLLATGGTVILPPPFSHVSAVRAVHTSLLFEYPSHVDEFAVCMHPLITLFPLRTRVCIRVMEIPSAQSALLNDRLARSHVAVLGESPG